MFPVGEQVPDAAQHPDIRLLPYDLPVGLHHFWGPIGKSRIGLKVLCKFTFLPPVQGVVVDGLGDRTPEVA